MSFSEQYQAPEPFESERFRSALEAEGRDEPLESERLQRWYELAAVLAWFEPTMIGAPVDPEELIGDEDWIVLVADCEIARTSQDGPRRRLKLLKRRDALARLKGRKGMRAALQETRDRPSHDPLQRALDRIILGDSINVLDLTQTELYALHAVSAWLDGLIDDLPDPAAIALRLRREELLQPHRLLAGCGFVGRKDELDELRSYVQELSASRVWERAKGAIKNLARGILDRPPLVIHGPGGVGKSTLVAQFILEHVERGELVFIDLDFGRPNLDPRRPAALLAESARQIATQVPARLAEGDALAADLELADATATQRSLESAHVFGLDEAIDRFCRFAISALRGKGNVPFVFDTFEEVEALGKSRVDSVWDLLRRLQSQLPQLRPVICSRIPISGSWALLNLPLRELEPEPAGWYLGDRLRSRHGEKLPRDLIQGMANRIARTPLALNLAAELLAQAVKAGEDPASVTARIKGKADEAFLYSRILEQIKDKDVRSLATPGLAVRRLDADVILNVLAAPCKVEVKNRDSAMDLLDRLANQVALVERESDGSLVHRADVRRLMLPAIEESAGLDVVRWIDRAAAVHYRQYHDIVSRTEQAYHLLRLGDIKTAESLLSDEVAQRLRLALDELPPDARLELCLRLGISPGAEELRTADQTRWERGALAAAQDLLASGDYKRVLSLLKSGSKRPPGGPLDRIEAEALIGVGDWKRALQVAEAGASAAQREGKRMSALELSLIMCRIGIATRDFKLAARALDNAESLTTAADLAETRLRILSMKIRLARLGSNFAAAEQIAQSALALLDSTTVAGLSPAVLRELAGELASDRSAFGEAADSIVRAALRRLGIEQKTEGLMEGLAAAITGWLAAGGPGASDVARVLSGIDGAPTIPRSLEDREAWRNWLRAIPGSLLGSALAAVLKVPGLGEAEPYAADVREVVAQYMRDAADIARDRDLSALSLSTDKRGR